jgi:hypothetical protein
VLTQAIVRGIVIVLEATIVVVNQIVKFLRQPTSNEELMFKYLVNVIINLFSSG